VRDPVAAGCGTVHRGVVGASSNDGNPIERPGAHPRPLRPAWPEPVSGAPGCSRSAGFARSAGCTGRRSGTTARARDPSSVVGGRVEPHGRGRRGEYATCSTARSVTRTT
jgi:hypothetical protein